MHAVTRFAPSPTGRLHLGHAYSALLAHDFARERGRHLPAPDRGYRSRPRSRPEYVDGIIEDLLWLGLEWDGEMLYQSERLAALRRGAGAAEGGRACSIPASAPAPTSPPARAAPQGPDGPALSRHLPRPAPTPISRGRMPGGSTSPRRRRGPGRSTGWTATPRSQAEPEALRRRRPRPQGRAGQLPSRRHGRRRRAGRHRRGARPRPLRLRPTSTACSRRCSACRRPPIIIMPC